jgi:ABC-2 type transport system ATP-binding protein
MNDDVIIELRGVSVRYRTYKSRRRSLRESVFRTLLQRDARVDVWALRDVDLVVRRGDSLGVLGHNGAGKSTLCLLLSGIMEPTSGTIDVRGHVSALLTLGAGFQNDLTGRDNILLNGVLLGHRLDEIEAKLPDIVAFAELEEHIDFPVRTYSAGMRARLAFSIAASIQPEILVIDELLGVGDHRFKQKSTKRMHELVKQSQALVVVSHNLSTIRSLCARTMWLHKGRVVTIGPTDEVLARYEAGDLPAEAVAS